MPVRLARCARLPRVPLWAAAVVLAWGAGVAAVYAISRRVGVVGTTCLFHRATGLPCPTCGGTRVVLRAAAGDLSWSFATNPGVFVALAIVLGLLALRVVAARRVDLGLGPRGRKAALAASVLLVLADWAYLIANEI